MANNKNQDEENDFPGYPHYPAKEDIMNKKNERVDLDVENLSRTQGVTSSGLPDKSVRLPQAENTEDILGDMDDDDPGLEKPGNDTDITPDDLIALGENETNYGTAESLVNNDLDVPGSEDDDANEAIGEEDEENNYYSLGGDAHENLEEDREG